MTYKIKQVVKSTPAFCYSDCDSMKHDIIAKLQKYKVDVNPMDVFYTTYGEREYKPRQSPTLTVEKPEQMKLF